MDAPLAMHITVLIVDQTIFYEYFVLHLHL